MADAVWMIIYDLERGHADEYLQWFDAVHIPEKLARPGYTWAAHYRITADTEPANPGYVALFGANDSRVFYNPSPAQIKPRQTPETRAMMALRSNSNMLILSEEWSLDAATGSTASSSAVIAQQISLALFDTNDNDENLGAWLTQEYLVSSGAASVTRKFLVSTGLVRHVLIRELGVDEVPRQGFVDAGSSDWSGQVSNYLSYPARGPLNARRTWPPIS
jgi:hypothetical protein